MFLEANHGKCKTYLLRAEHGAAALIDPLRDRIDRYLGLLAYHHCDLEWIIDTHTHADHRSGAAELADLTGAHVVMHRRSPNPHVDRHVEDGDELAIGEIRLQILHTPGHTPDSISVCAGGRVFTGDVLLIHGTGRTDFAGGDAGESYDSIEKKLFKLPDSTIVFPGHDYRGHTQSTIGEERVSNPRVAGRSRAEYVQLMNNLGLPLPDTIQEVLQPNQSEIDASSIKFPPLAQLNAVRQIEANDLQRMLASSQPPVLIDVREASEFSGELGHIRSARLIPLKELPERVGEIEQYRHDELVAICRVGVRSTTAAAILTAMGFERVYNLKGGMLEWNDARLPVER
jgi:glyoxylase-like metal-dependent hydrolase (beta-lactamase superfamily II)/rhodanese-related sulfurtransferase